MFVGRSSSHRRHVQHLQGRGEAAGAAAQGEGPAAGQLRVPAPLPVHLHRPHRLQHPRHQLQLHRQEGWVEARGLPGRFHT